MSSIMEDVQDFDWGSIVELYDIDLAGAGFDQMLHLTPSSGDGTSIFFGDIEYVPRGFEMTGFSRSSQGAPPEPTMTIGNADKGGNALLASYNALIGAKVTRRRTLAKYLDFLADGVTPNPTADAARQFMPEIWYVEQKEYSDSKVVKWRMKSVLDLEGQEMPKRRVLKNWCERLYRVAKDDDTFQYAATNACPYDGDGMWDQFGNVTANPQEDDCDHSHTGCGLRFPEGLMTWAFPGADRIPQ